MGTINTSDFKKGLKVQLDGDPYLMTECNFVKPGKGQAFRDCPECPEMVVAPAGQFTMGAPPHEEVYSELDREVQVEVTIATPFAVARHAVTRGEFAAFAAATGRPSEGDCAGWIEGKWTRDPQRNWRSPGCADSPRSARTLHR